MHPDHFNHFSIAIESASVIVGNFRKCRGRVDNSCHSSKHDVSQLRPVFPWSFAIKLYRLSSILGPPFLRVESVNHSRRNSFYENNLHREQKDTVPAELARIRIGISTFSLIPLLLVLVFGAVA
jgi:hypothetical protein